MLAFTTVEIRFEDDDTASLCNRSERLTARSGMPGGRLVGRRLIQIDAAPTIEALLTLPGKCRPDASDGTWLIDVADVAVIRFRLGIEGADASTKVYVISVNDHPHKGARR